MNILAAEQSLENRDWYQGTADAVRQNLRRLVDQEPSEVVILSGDQLYLMDLAGFVGLSLNSLCTSGSEVFSLWHR